MINPENLKRQREKKNLTLDELAAKANVDRGTINRIETGRSPKCRSSTARKLAEALGVEVGLLIGPTAEEDDGAVLFGRKSQMNIRMTDEARNALTLVADRYGLKPTAIVHIAPFLFLWAAEASLKLREKKLVEVAKQMDALFGIDAPKHLSGVLVDHWRGEEVMEAERRSIAKRDLFGVTIPDEFRASIYEEEEHNPFARFLESLAKSMDGLAEFDSWSPGWDQPMYSVGREEAANLTGGDERATMNIVQGSAALHSMPKQVREGGPIAVAQWAREEGEKLHKERFGDLDFDFGEEDGDE